MEQKNYLINMFSDNQKLEIKENEFYKFLNELINTDIGFVFFRHSIEFNEGGSLKEIQILRKADWDTAANILRRDILMNYEELIEEATTSEELIGLIEEIESRIEGTPRDEGGSWSAHDIRLMNLSNAAQDKLIEIEEEENECK